jgi:hypothetical protein
VQNSSSFCRSQEAIQNKRADETALVNVKTIARKAAEMWRLEADAAEHREERHRKRAATAQTNERQASENPDRGFADET